MYDSDAQAVLAIYKKGLASWKAAFETQVPLWKDWDRSHHRFCRFVFVDFLLKHV